MITENREHKIETAKKLKSKGYVKIGSSVDTKRRLTDLQVAHAEPIILLAVVEQDEDSLHEKFSCYRVRGEWFVLSEEIKQYVKMHHPKLPS